jgi:hypothetical protein
MGKKTPVPIVDAKVKTYSNLPQGNEKNISKKSGILFQYLSNLKFKIPSNDSSRCSRRAQ